MIYSLVGYVTKLRKEYGGYGMDGLCGGVVWDILIILMQQQQ